MNELKAALDTPARITSIFNKPNEGHGFYEVSDRCDLAKKLLKFFRREIGG